MKKRLLFVAAIFAATATFAQDGLTSKKGEAYLPEAGDWAIGIDANPLFNYVGNMANAGTNGANTLNANWFRSNTIYGKMFKDENTAYRVAVRLGFGSNTVGSTVQLLATPSAVQTTDYTNEVKSSYNAINLGFGIEKRRGNTRIQGVYGAMLNIGFGGGKTEYTYGLALGDSSVTANPSLSGTRPTEMKNGSTFELGITGFAGVEWFFAPKVSLGFEYSWGLSMQSTGESETTTEEWAVTPGAAAGTNPSLQTVTTKGGKASSFALDTGLSGSSISLNFHF